MFGIPIETLGPECISCGFRHEVRARCRRLITSEELEILREQWRNGIFPDKGVDR